MAYQVDRGGMLRGLGTEEREVGEDEDEGEVERKYQRLCFPGSHEADTPLAVLSFLLAILVSVTRRRLWESFGGPYLTQRTRQREAVSKRSCKKKQV